jgi:hypothetical protein
MQDTPPFMAWPSRSAVSGQRHLDAEACDAAWQKTKISCFRCSFCHHTKVHGQASELFPDLNETQAIKKGFTKLAVCSKNTNLMRVLSTGAGIVLIRSLLGTTSRDKANGWWKAQTGCELEISAVCGCGVEQCLNTANRNRVTKDNNRRARKSCTIPGELAAAQDDTDGTLCAERCGSDRLTTVAFAAVGSTSSGSPVCLSSHITAEDLLQEKIESDQRKLGRANKQQQKIVAAFKSQKAKVNFLNESIKKNQRLLLLLLQDTDNAAVVPLTKSAKRRKRKERQNIGEQVVLRRALANAEEKLSQNSMRNEPSATAQHRTPALNQNYFQETHGRALEEAKAITNTLNVVCTLSETCFTSVVAWLTPAMGMDLAAAMQAGNGTDILVVTESYDPITEEPHSIAWLVVQVGKGKYNEAMLGACAFAAGAHFSNSTFLFSAHGHFLRNVFGDMNTLPVPLVNALMLLRVLRGNVHVILDGCSTFGEIGVHDSLEQEVRKALPTVDAVGGYIGSPLAELDGAQSPKAQGTDCVRRPDLLHRYELRCGLHRAHARVPATVHEGASALRTEPAASCGGGRVCSLVGSAEARWAGVLYGVSKQRGRRGVCLPSGLKGHCHLAPGMSEAGQKTHRFTNCQISSQRV